MLNMCQEKDILLKTKQKQRSEENLRFLNQVFVHSYHILL